MKLNKKLELGVNVVNELKNHQGPARVRDLAVKVNTTTAFLEQVMRNMRQAGLVTSTRGPGGGYSLSANQPNITAYHVAKAVGHDFGVLNLGNEPMNRLTKAVSDAFLGTVI
jgi:Rrf2 family iron-sulfur cluster assembly transcriptional regulator